MRLCRSYGTEHLRNALASGAYVLDFDGVLVHRFTQYIDWLSARRELAKAMIERGFDVGVVSRYVDPYDLIKICYGDWGIHRDFDYFSKILEYFELNAMPRLIIDPYAKAFLEAALKLDKRVYISTLQATSVVSSFLKLINVPSDRVAVKARDSGGRPKPYADQLAELYGADVVVIGDSCTDGYLARSLKSWFVALETNGYTSYELCYAGAVTVFDDLGELIRAVAEVHGHV